MLVSRLGLAVMILGYLVFVAGCAPKAQPGATADAHGDHDHDHEEHHFETYDEAVKGLGEMRDKIRDAFAKEDADTAHGPLHEVGHLLEELPELAKKAGHPDEVLASVKEHSEKLFDLFDKVDRKLHGEEGVAYDEVSADVDAALAKLEHPEAKPAEPATP
ncbi:MAG: hypothetical protein KF708_01335 [Pirellulales bacterium]|nr:hypothetical protein [Pirellulales bacterium]